MRLVLTAQKRQPRVHVSPISMIVAVAATPKADKQICARMRESEPVPFLPPQHSPMFGHRASSQTVASPKPRTAQAARLSLQSCSTSEFTCLFQARVVLARGRDRFDPFRLGFAKLLASRLHSLDAFSTQTATDCSNWSVQRWRRNASLNLSVTSGKVTSKRGAGSCGIPVPSTFQ